MGPAPEITAFFDEATNSVSYLVADPATRAAAVIDPVLDFDPASGTDRDRVRSTRSWPRRTSKGFASRGCSKPTSHADHLSAAAIIRERTGAKVGDRRRHSTRFRRRSVRCSAARISSRRRFRSAASPTANGSPLGELDDRGDRDARPHAGLRQLSDRRCGVRRRYLVHAGLWHCAVRFPGGDAAPALPVDPAHPGAAARDAAVHVPRLQGAGPRRISRGRRRSARRPTATSTSAAACPKRSIVAMRAGPGRDPVRAQAALSGDPGEHPRRPPAAGRSRTARVYLKIPGDGRRLAQGRHRRAAESRP